MKRFISIILSIVLASFCLTACGGENSQPDGSDDKIQIVTTIFPEYDWVMNILGDNPADAEVTMLLDDGVDLHSYQPTTDDILKISSCDLFIYVGGESDEWVEDALKEAANEDMIVIDLMDSLDDSVKEEELVEGMQSEEEDEGEEESEPEYDEHVWLSLNNACILTEVISDAIQTIDPENAETYKANTEAYVRELKELDAQYKSAVAEAGNKTLIFGDRIPFRYLTDDYGLDYYAAFVGCSAETEASFETVTFLSQKIDELSVHTILTIEGTDQSIAETIRDNTKTKDQQILTMDSMQSTTAKDVENGATYLSIMKDNLAVLKEALK